MHSHSGQFCPGHAKDQLEDIILHAIKVGYKTIGLTEHMPRTDLADLYPEEVCMQNILPTQQPPPFH
jgi:histidinol-phosphatase (PHP family)